MRIAVLGATGPSGVQVVKEALNRGHQVTALVRNPDKVTEKHENLKLAKVDIYNDDTMVEHMAGQDAILSCLGCPPSWFSLRTITFYTDTAKPIVSAMRKASVQRLIFMTSWYTVYDRNHPFFINWILKPILLGKSKLHNMGEMEEYMRKECDDIEYTSVRPPTLTNSESTGTPVQSHEGQFVPGKSNMMCRQDVAKFMLDTAESGEWKRKCVAITVG